MDLTYVALSISAGTDFTNRGNIPVVVQT